MKKVSCIIPAYNEGPRIENVLTAAARHPLIGEIIVINDGSTDDTHDVAAKFPITLITEEHNRGKTAALLRGIEAATSEFLLFLDADLVGISAADITELLTPVLSGNADTSMSLRNNYPLWSWVGVDFLSGERVLPRAFLTPHIAKLQKLPRFGFEIFVNDLIIRACLRLAVVKWKGVASPFKYKKYGIWGGFRADLSMVREIFKTISFIDVFRQISALSALKVPSVPNVDVELPHKSL
ncbi:glycosyltransferase family 2 protein [Candidatus Kaiserbacteria bacterium]|nr:glycosyltransferase family 2 protein [Candidatus Kaiserbacteria bacterium]